MTLIGGEEAQYNMLAMKLQRDVNCLGDPERSIRRRACDKLLRVLQSDANQLSVNLLRELFSVNMKEALLTCASTDSVEKCREKSILILLFFAERKSLEHSATMLKALVNLLSTRLGKLPYAEPTEEIRLLLLQLLHIYLAQLATVGSNERLSLRDEIVDLANVLGKTAIDPFPDVKKLTADTAIVLSTAWRIEVGMQLGMIVKPMVTNLCHQHSRVRVSALQALEALIPCGSEALGELMKDVLYPALRKVMVDRAPSVRKQLVLTIATWMRDIREIRQYQAMLVPFYLAGVVDDSQEVRDTFHSTLMDLSVKWEAYDENNEETSGHDDEPMLVESVNGHTPPAYFTKQPPIGSRRMANRTMKDVLPYLLDKTSDWTAQTRALYCKVLSAYLILLEDGMNPHLDKIFNSLAKICRDDEEFVLESVKECSHVVGHYADTALILASLLPMVSGRVVGQDTASHRTNGLILLGMSVEGMTSVTIEPYLNAITESLCDSGVRESEVPTLQDQLAVVVASIVKTAGPLFAAKCELNEVVFRLFWVLNHLLAASTDDTVASEISIGALNELASACGQSVEDIYKRFLGSLLEKMQLPTDKATTWKKNDPSRVLFDSLCRRGGSACAHNMSTLVPTFLVHLEPSQDADIRLAFLALLETMLNVDVICPSFKPFNSKLLLGGIVPNIVWQGGRVAATIRKVAVACAYTLLRQGLADQPCLYECAPQMLPVLKSSIDDGDAKTRQLVCLALQYLFVALPGCLGEEPVHQLYAEILKRLDDSNDIVRKAACQTFRTFLRAAPKSHFQGTIIQYTLDCLFVHLDDADPEIQEMVLDVIKECLDVDTPLLIKKAQENRSRHQSSKYCDQILAFATARLG